MPNPPETLPREKITPPRTRDELLAAIEADFASGRTIRGRVDGLIGTVTRFCLVNDGISLSSSDALLLCEAILNHCALTNHWHDAAHAPDGRLWSDKFAGLFAAAEEELAVSLAKGRERDELRKRLEELQAHTRRIGNALMSFTPGGSEYFTQIGGDFYADPAACKKVIADRLDSGHKSKKELFRLRKQLAGASND